MSTPSPVTPAEATPPARAGCGRRAVLRAAGLVALTGGAAALAGCGADSAAVPAPGSTPTGSGSPASRSGQGAPRGTAVAILEVAVGGGVVVEQTYVVTQPTAGVFQAFSAICTHQGCPVDSVEDGAIICPCHGSRFDIGTGEPISGPAQQPLPAVSFTKTGDRIVVTG